MKKSILSLLLMVAMLPLMANAEYVQLADGVYQDGTTLYICGDVTSLGDLQVNPSEIYCYATIPPACVSNTFTGFDATLHVPAAGMVSYFTTLYWYNFNNILSDAIEPQEVTINISEASIELGKQLSLSASVSPGDATPRTIYWSSTNTSVATVNTSGRVTAVAPGECYICATCIDKQALCHITVTPEFVTITLDRHEARLLPNHTLTLTATCSPFDVDLAVTSSDPQVAIPRLVNGTIMVVGVGEGTATITVNATDGWGNPDSCTVTVYTEHGDVNCDGYVSIADVTSLIDYLLSGDDSQISTANADVNNNDNISIADVTTLIDYLLSGIWTWEKIYTVNGVSFIMVTVDGGTFTMGATTEQISDASDYETPAHEVTLSSYCIGKTEVTQALWEAVMGSNPSYFTGNLQCPVEKVSWDDCQAFISQLNQMTGLNFRLPTEAEWEYAARGGNMSLGHKYAGSDNINDVAWYWDNIPSQNENGDGYGTQAVASKYPNELGIYDMSGNVWEWCQDRFGDYNIDAQTNPTGPSSGTNHVSRGGGWFDGASGCRVSNRLNDNTAGRSDNHGFRLALDVENSSKFQLSKSVITVEVGKSKSVNILNGNGNYTVSNEADNFSSSINGNRLIVTGTAIGTNTVTVTDISTAATAVLTVIVEHEWVDLGLSSGTLWAKGNVGASSPEGYGYYFAWGETQRKSVYNWSNYKWCNGSYNTMTKYCTNSDNGYNGFVDDKTELDLEDDAAYIYWGALWRMPSREQISELLTSCSSVWTTLNGVNGRLLTGPNGNTLFLPATGARGNSLSQAGEYGYFWSRSLAGDYGATYMSIQTYCAYYLGHRCSGYTVRPVRVSQN